MKVKDTGKLLENIRSFMVNPASKLDETLQAVIVPSSDAHQVTFQLLLKIHLI